MMIGKTLWAGDAPAESGVYLLWMQLSQPVLVSPGRLAPQTLPAGHFAYVGSALGPGGLRARLRHHTQALKGRHWHIDYLTTTCAPQAILYVVSQQRLECVWVQALRAAGAACPIVGFGNSDCRQPGCQAHLVHLPAAWSLLTIEDLLSWTICN